MRPGGWRADPSRPSATLPYGGRARATIAPDGENSGESLAPPLLAGEGAGGCGPGMMPLPMPAVRLSFGHIGIADASQATERVGFALPGHAAAWLEGNGALGGDQPLVELSLLV